MTEEQAKTIIADVSAQMIKTPITTTRTMLRPFVEADFEDYFEFASQKEQQRLSGSSEISTTTEAREAFDRILAANPTTCFAVVLKDENRVIGDFSIGVYPFLRGNDVLGNQRGVSLSFGLNENYWRRGLMTEVIEEAFALFFGAAQLDFVNMGYFDFNLASKRLQEKLGLKPWMEHIVERGDLKIPTQEMLMTKEDYEARQIALLSRHQDAT